MPLVVATDGSCLGNPGPGGWAWVTEDGRVGSAAGRRSTNNRMELRAVLGLLQSIDPDEELVIQTDSSYVIGVFTEWLSVWKKRGMRTGRNKPVENADLIVEIDELLAGRKVTFEKVPGHAGHPLNEKADALARSEAERAQRTVATEESMRAR